MFHCLRASVRLAVTLIPKINISSQLTSTLSNGITFQMHKLQATINQSHSCSTWSHNNTGPKSLLHVASPFTPQPNRNITKFSLKKGKRKSCRTVLKRFYRLDWGVWIHTKCGRAKKLYRKSANRKRRLRQHVFTNATQSWLLDKMVTSYWRRPKLYVDDPYEPYHSREEFLTSRRKPYVPTSG